MSLITYLDDHANLPDPRVLEQARLIDVRLRLFLDEYRDVGDWDYIDEEDVRRLEEEIAPLHEELRRRTGGPRKRAQAMVSTLTPRLSFFPSQVVRGAYGFLQYGLSIRSRTVPPCPGSAWFSWYVLISFCLSFPFHRTAIVQDYYSTAGKFVVVNYSVTNTSPQVISPNPLVQLHVRAGGNVEVYEQSEQISPPRRNSPGLYLDDIPPHQLLMSQFIFDVPADVEPELLAVSEQHDISTVTDVGVVDLTREDPLGPSPEEVQALEYQYWNMAERNRDYELYAEESKALVSAEEYASSIESRPPEAITQYSFPTVNVQGDRATIERVYTSETEWEEAQFSPLRNTFGRMKAGG